VVSPPGDIVTHFSFNTYYTLTPQLAVNSYAPKYRFWAVKDAEATYTLTADAPDFIANPSGKKFYLWLFAAINGPSAVPRGLAPWTKTTALSCQVSSPGWDSKADNGPLYCGSSGLYSYCYGSDISMYKWMSGMSPAGQILYQHPSSSGNMYEVIVPVRTVSF
jgi:hypothetical protein